MTNTTPHPYAHILHAIAEGKTIQLGGSDTIWRDTHPNEVLQMIGAGTYEQQGIRIKPRVILINGHEVPEPLRVEPPEGTSYWVPAILSPYGENTSAGSWTDGDNDNRWLQHNRWLQQGLVHLTEEAAQAHANALVSITTTTAP